MIYNMVEEIWLIQHKERFDKSLDRIRTMYRLYQEDNRYEIENNGLDIDSVPLFIEYCTMWVAYLRVNPNDDDLQPF